MKLLVREAKHIINRVYISIETTGGFKPEISNDEIISAVKYAFDSCDFQDTEEIFVVDKLEVDLTLTKSDLHFLKDKLSGVLLEKINSAVNDKSGKFKSIVQQQRSDFLEYLRTGKLAWNSGGLIYRDHFLEDTGFRENLKKIFKTGKISIDRFIYKLELDQLLNVLKEYYDRSFFNDISKLLNQFLNVAKKLNQAYDLEYRLQKYLFQELFYKLFLENSRPEARVLIEESVPGILQKSGIGKEELSNSSLLKDFSNGKITEMELSVESTQGLRGRESLSQSQQISNAGIVLLHPFLPRFYDKLGLLEGKDFQSENCRERAVCLLHYLATGETNFPIEELTFAKFLCHFPLELPVPEQLPISPFEIEESKNLLENVIDHWKALKNTSVEGLRLNFFDRIGLLQKENNIWTMNMENQTSDVLIDRLPWPVSPVKLPWMPELLTVNWN